MSKHTVVVWEYNYIIEIVYLCNSTVCFNTIIDIIVVFTVFCLLYVNNFKELYSYTIFVAWEAIR